MTRKEQLNKAREIYDEIMKDGTYTNEQIEEGYKLVFPDKEYPNGIQARREFIGYHQYMFHTVMKELEDFFIEDEQTHGEAIPLPEQPVQTLDADGNWIDDDPERDYQQERIDKKPSEELIKQKNRVTPKAKAKVGRPKGSTNKKK